MNQNRHCGDGVPPVEVIFKPSVYRLGFTEIDDSELNRFAQDYKIDAEDGALENMQGSVSECIVEIAGRACYQSFNAPRPGGSKAYFDNILASKHFSVTEHASFSFMITGISRSLSHELVRHRHLQFSQLSQRYVDESEVAFICPPDIMDGSDVFYVWLNAMQCALASYQKLADLLEDTFPLVHLESKTDRRKRVRQTARSVLPNATETRMMVTGNVRAWRHFLNLRATKQADTEIRNLASAIYPKLVESAPALFGDYTKEFGGTVLNTANTEV